jgi:hypothetical protein
MNNEAKGTITRLSNKLSYFVNGNMCIIGSEVYKRETVLSSGKSSWKQITLSNSDLSKLFKPLLTFLFGISSR